MNTKQAVETIVYNEDPRGLKMMRKAGSNLVAFVVPRADLKELKNFDFSENPAVYFLIGESEEKYLYIGKTDSFMRRIQQHSGHKDYWDMAIGFIAEKDLNVSYLEKICWEEAQKSDRYIIKNDQNPSGEKISEFAQASNDGYFREIKFLTSLLGISIFTQVQENIQEKESYYIKNDNFQVVASGKLVEGNDFVVFKGSTARLDEVPSFATDFNSSWVLRNRLKEEGILDRNEHNYFFTKDYTFTSPSAAADVIMARHSNGWTTWKDHRGLTLDENIRKV